MDDRRADIAGHLAEWLARRHPRRSFIGMLGRAALALSGASLLEAIELAAPSKSAFALHCISGYHSGGACALQTNCFANYGQAGDRLINGQYWLSCCSAANICGNCFDGWRYVKFQDCCTNTRSCGGKTPKVYCPSPTCFSCKIQSCTSTQCRAPGGCR